MTRDTDEALRRISTASGMSPDLRTDPRAVKCDCGALLYPGQICQCQLASLQTSEASRFVRDAVRYVNDWKIADD